MSCQRQLREYRMKVVTMCVVVVALIHGLQSPTLFAAEYYPPSDSEGGWRTLLSAPNETPSSKAREQIADVASLDWNDLRRAWEYSKDADVASGVLVIRHGWVAGEWGNTRKPTGVASVSKSLSGLAMFKLFELSKAGNLPNNGSIHLESRAYTYLPSSWGNTDSRRRNIRIEHLMTMSSGLDPHDSPNSSEYTTQFILNRNVINAPGETWAYASLPVDMLSIICQEVSGQSLSQFLNAKILRRIGSRSISWGKIDNHITKGSSSAKIAATDLARIGYLLLKEGTWQNTRLLKPESVSVMTSWASLLAEAKFSTTPGSPFVVPEASPDHYGYLWWTNLDRVALGRSVPRDAFYAHGFGEDLLIIIPSLDMVVVRVGGRPTGRQASSFRREFMTRIMQGVLQE